MLVTPSIPLEGDDRGSVRTNAAGRRFAVLRPASDDAWGPCDLAHYGHCGYIWCLGEWWRDGATGVIRKVLVIRLL